MRKIYEVTAILLLFSAWVLAESSSQSTNRQNRSSASAASQQPALAEKSQTGTQDSSSDQMSQTIQGCLGRAAGSFTLTDASGKIYQLAGDSSKLSDYVGHTVWIAGSEESGAAATSPAGPQRTFTIKNMKIVSSSCSTSK